MHEDHILHKEIWHHHGLLLDADLNDLFMLLDDHIRHRDIWHHYKLLFDADTDYLLLQLDDQIFHMEISHHYELTFDAYSDYLWCRLMTTFSTGIFDIMNCLWPEELNHSQKIL